MTKMEEICSVSFVDHEAASELLREFTGKEGGVATVDWYLLRNKIADAMSMTRVDEREKCRQLLSEAEKREKEALTRLSELAATATDDLMEKWTSDLGATVDTKAAGVAANIINDFSGHIEAALIKLERRAALERSEAEAVTKSMQAEAQRLLANKPKRFGKQP